MKKLNIQNLYIQKADYIVEDDHGNSITVNINYWENRFAFEVQSKMNDNIRVLKEEASKLAKDLLRRKSRVNFGK